MHFCAINPFVRSNNAHDDIIIIKLHKNVYQAIDVPACLHETGYLFSKVEQRVCYIHKIFQPNIDCNIFHKKNDIRTKSTF